MSTFHFHFHYIFAKIGKIMKTLLKSDLIYAFKRSEMHTIDV